MARTVKDGVERKGFMRVTMPNGGFDADEQRIQVTLEDETSGIRFLTISIRPADFALALMSQQSEVTYELGGANRLGMKSENKTEFVLDGTYKSHGHTTGGTKLSAEEALRSFVVDGWSARAGDYGNQHRHSHNAEGHAGYSVTFFRHVNPTTGKPVL